MNTLLKLAVSAVVIVANVYAVEMPDFELDLEHRNTKQLKEIAEKDINVAFGVDAFTEHYRAHMWDVRNNYKHTPMENDIVRYENLKYYNTVYKLIPTEIARCIFDIKDGMIEYTDNYDDILECKGSVPVEQYNQSNWNYVVLVNVLNRYRNYTKGHNKKHTISKIIKEVCEGLNKRYGKGYASIIDDAANDIKVYLDTLRLDTLFNLESRKNKIERYRDALKNVDKSIEEERFFFIGKYGTAPELNKDIMKWITMKSMFSDVEPITQHGTTYYICKQKYRQEESKDEKDTDAYIRYVDQDEKLKGFEKQNAWVTKNIGAKSLEKEKYLRNIITISDNELQALWSISDDKYVMDRVRKYIDNCRKDAETGALNQNYSNKLIEIYNMLNQVGGKNLEPLVAGMCDVVDMDGNKDKKQKITEQQKAAMSKRVKRFHEALQIDEEKAKQMGSEDWRKYLRQAIKEALLDAKTITKEEAEKITQ